MSGQKHRGTKLDRWCSWINILTENVNQNHMWTWFVLLNLCVQFQLVSPPIYSPHNNWKNLKLYKKCCNSITSPIFFQFLCYTSVLVHLSICLAFVLLKLNQCCSHMRQYGPEEEQLLSVSYLSFQADLFSQHKTVH